MASVRRQPGQSNTVSLESLAGPYSFKPLIENAELSADSTVNPTIACVEYWQSNLYIGTSAGELLHFVSIPGEDASQEPAFILASRLEPSPSDKPSGVKQILILARSNKACILCNGIVSFHTLPELSPAQGHGKPSNCVWIGAQDLDLMDEEDGEEDVIMIAMRNKLRLVRTSRDQKPQLLSDIEYAGCLNAARRSRFACVADNETYALLDLENRQKIPLFPISSSNKTSSSMGQRQDLPDAGAPHSRSTSAVHGNRASEPGQQSHGRTASLGNLVNTIGRRSSELRSESRDSRLGRDLDEGSRDRSTLSPPAQSPRRASPSPAGTPEKPLPAPPQDRSEPSPQRKQILPAQQLRPNIVSPLPTEFLLTTGTAATDRGVGVFVNCDGDVVRGTLEFGQYPSSVIVDGGYPRPLRSIPQFESETEGYVLASMTKPGGDEGGVPGLEIQRWNTAGESKTWLPFPNAIPTESSENAAIIGAQLDLGVVNTRTTSELAFGAVVDMLRLRRCKLYKSEETTGTKGSDPATKDDGSRNRQEDEFAGRFGQASSNIIAWQGVTLNWIVRNPLLVRLNAQVEQVLLESNDTGLDQTKLLKLLATIRNREARSEAEFLGLDFIRQKISLILFADLAVNQIDVNPQVNGELLTEGGTDPRIMLSMVPLLRKDIFEGNSGIWIHDGLNQLMRTRLASVSITLDSDEVLSRPEEFDILTLIKQYLHAWRQKKGFGSIADEMQVFQPVDASLLHILLHQDQQSSLGPGASSSLRAELYAVVDQKVDCFDRAVELLEEYHRLYVLSRLYQSRNNRTKVLATWRRIIEGDRDDGGEFTNGEAQIPQYLAKTKDAAVFEEYATWLSQRNPTLGVQVFTEDKSKVQLPPRTVVQLLREKAPDAVKDYLEYLVFGKKNVQYANELISFYLDNVLGVLESSEEARETLAESYTAYRALEAPRPTYRQFISDNARSEPWWNDRLRLLELLGGSHGAGFSYDVASVLNRIEPFEEQLVPESIILDGRQGRHQQALRLLTHGLGDFHTAINYCLLGGSSIFHPASGALDGPGVPTQEEQSSLFRFLLLEFLRIEDEDNSIQRTSELLGRFSSWFDVEQVLAQLPDSWSVEAVSMFLMSTFRRMVQERNEASITKALSGVENLRISAEFVEKCEQAGPHIVPATDTPTSSS